MVIAESAFLAKDDKDDDDDDNDEGKEDNNDDDDLRFESVFRGLGVENAGDWDLF